jgi:glycine reductase complex component B subunit gamma
MGVRVVHYLNQFFAGIGGEAQAGTALTVREGPVGAARALQQALGAEGEVAATLICGDNHFHDDLHSVLMGLRTHLARLRPQLLVAGPAFAAGRYGLACGQVCRLAQALGIPAVTGMHRDNPAVHGFRADVRMVPTGETPADMPQALAAMVRVGLKLSRGEALGPAELEGTISSGVRRVYDRGRPGYERALAMLLDKLHGRPFTTEVPIYTPERVEPAPALAELRAATIGMVTTGGLVRKGNPEGQVAANATRYHRHSVKELESLSAEGWEAFHAGYFNHIVNRNPNYILPLNFLRDLERAGEIGAVYENIYALPGVSTPVAMAARMGRSIAEELKAGGVDGALLVAT